MEEQRYAAAEMVNRRQQRNDTGVPTQGTGAKVEKWKKNREGQAGTAQRKVSYSRSRLTSTLKKGGGVKRVAISPEPRGQR